MFGSELSAFTVKDEVVSSVPVLDDVEAFLDFASQRFGVQVPTQKDRFDRLAQLRQRLVSGVFEVIASEALQNRFGLRRAQA